MSRVLTRLPNEIPEGEWITLRPHPLSFVHLYGMSLFLIIWGVVLHWLFNTSSQWGDLESKIGELPLGNIFDDTALSIGAAGGATSLWFIGLIIAGFVASHLWIDRGGYAFFGMCAGIGIIGIFVIGYQAKYNSEDIVEFYQWFLPALSVGMGAVGFLGIDYYRRGFRYTLTNLRIVIAKKFITLDERIVRFNHVEDVKVNQSVFGRMFGYGHVIPLTGSGIGTGTEESIAVGSVGKEVDGVNVGFSGGSKAGIRKAKPSPGDCLFGVKAPLKIRGVISRYIQENTGVSVAKRQEDTLGRIEELLRLQAEAGAPKDQDQTPPVE
jgi:hypothetical protein